MRRETEPPHAAGAVSGRPSGAELLRAVLVPCALYISLQFLGLVLHITGAAQRTNWPATLATVCSLLAWLVFYSPAWCA